MEEIWLPIKDIDGKYEVSNFGRIRNSKRGNILQGSINPITGYEMVNLRFNGNIKTYPKHRLVAIAFIENPLKLPNVNHIDENKTNNCIDNLEWITQKDNVTYGNAQKKRINSRIVNNNIGNKVCQIDSDDTIIAEYNSYAEAERATGIARQSIGAVIRGSRKTAGKYKWKLKEND